MYKLAYKFPIMTNSFYPTLGTVRACYGFLRIFLDFLRCVMIPGSWSKIFRGVITILGSSNDFWRSVEFAGILTPKNNTFFPGF